MASRAYVAFSMAPSTLLAPSDALQLVMLGLDQPAKPSIKGLKKARMLPLQKARMNGGGPAKALCRQRFPRAAVRSVKRMPSNTSRASLSLRPPPARRTQVLSEGR